jgi:hypothetical protein
MQTSMSLMGLICTGSVAVALLVSALFACLFHLGLRDFQDYERQDG